MLIDIDHFLDNIVLLVTSHCFKELLEEPNILAQFSKFENDKRVEAFNAMRSHGGTNSAEDFLNQSQVYGNIKFINFR